MSLRRQTSDPLAEIPKVEIKTTYASSDCMTSSNDVFPLSKLISISSISCFLKGNLKAANLLRVNPMLSFLSA